MRIDRGVRVRLVGLACVAAGLTFTASGCSGPATETRAASPASVTTTVVPGCPAVTATAGRFAAVDYSDFVVHRGVVYEPHPEVTEPPPTTSVGRVAFRVACTFSDLNERTKVQPPPPTEHSAGLLPVGAAVHTVTGWPQECRLTAQRDGRWVQYVAVVRGSDPLDYDPCGLDPDRFADDTRS